MIRSLARRVTNALDRAGDPGGGVGFQAGVTAKVVRTTIPEIRGEMAETVALSYIEHKGVEYNYGDPVPSEVAEAYPTAVGPAPISEKDLSKMTKADMEAELRRLSGLAPAEPTDGDDE